jgi:aldehyde dehydrogenase (NAD+)
VLHSYIAGERVESHSLVPDLNPATGEIVAWSSRADADVALRATASAREAFAGWRLASGHERGGVLARAADVLVGRAEEIGRDLAREQGKTLAEAVGEVRRAADVFRYFAGQALEPDGATYPSAGADTVLLIARRRPVGVVAVVTPWNFPLALPAWKLAPAMVYGNTVVWKPAEIVPLSSSHLLEALVAGGLPPGVLNLVQGSGSEVGSRVIASPDVDAVTFTGSNSVGRSIVAGAAGKRMQLELGGKNAAVVLADANLHDAARKIARAAFMMAGQKCTATSRVIVESPVYEAFLERFVHVADSLVVGDPLDPAVEIGPLASQSQFETVERYLEIGLRDGERATARGVDDVPSGNYVPPTVFTGLARESAVVTDEIFGPVVAVSAVESYDEAIASLNDSPFGLSASLFTSDLNRALTFGRDADCGVVKVNQESSGLEFHVPFGGMKQSGLGPQEQGKAAAEFFTRWQTTYIDTSSVQA